MSSRSFVSSATSSSSTRAAGVTSPGSTVCRAERSVCARGGAGGRDVECASDEGGGEVGGGGIVEVVRGACDPCDAERGVRRGCVDGAQERGVVEGGGGVAPRENPVGGGGTGVWGRSSACPSAAPIVDCGVERPSPEDGMGGGGTEAGFVGRAAGGGGVGVGPRCGGGVKNGLLFVEGAGLSSGFVTGGEDSRVALDSPFAGSSENARRDDPRPGEGGVGPVAPGGPFMVVTLES
ncbi:hypothetical protein [Polyangium sp. 15x6]|uniref:hypothetical protein n=1 Tax=Polyangium sp. 15x6 TaxID=3042687 RepID=UPI00249C7853|nr:hypothetical protein [Polyangium sp. 15x6]MDI3283419.1 hypothetical protein [Polyangium sp. 15x6]